MDGFAYVHEVRTAELVGRTCDVRALDAVHSRVDGFGNPDLLLRVDAADRGSYGDFKRIDPPKAGTFHSSDLLSRRVAKSLRTAFHQDPRITVAIVDGREAGVTTDDAVRGVRRALGSWRQHGIIAPSGSRMLVFTTGGGSVSWRGDSGVIDVSE